MNKLIKENNMFKPVNRYLQLELLEEESEGNTPAILLPDDFKPQQQRYGVALVVAAADDIKFEKLLHPETKVIVDKSMIEEINFMDKSINVVLENYIVGIVS
jgi:hypothetical protein